MPSMTRWNKGAPVVWRSRPDGVVGAAIPMIVVEDGPDVVALFQPSGTICKRRTGVRGGPRGRSMLHSHGSHHNRVYSGPDSVRVHVPGSGFEVIRTWTGSAFEGWYVNLVLPWRRTRLGFDTWDQMLDLVLTDDLSSWAWKDDDEFAFALQEGQISPEEAARVRAEGLRAITLMEARRFPFHEGWIRFRPNDDWPVPALPPDWQAFV